MSSVIAHRFSSEVFIAKCHDVSILLFHPKDAVPINHIQES